MEFFKLNLQLLADGGAEGGASSDGMSSNEAAESGVATTIEHPRMRKAKSKLSDVKYGKAEDIASPNSVEIPGEETIETAMADAKAEPSFEDLIGKDGKYKAEFDAKVQSIVKDRLKNSKATEEKLAKLNPVIELLGIKYGVDVSDIDNVDIDKLTKTIIDDDSYYEDEALEKGIPVETLKELKTLQRNNDEMRKALEIRQQREQSDKAFAEIVRQSENLKQLYPSFDLNTEMSNSQFAKLVANGVPLQTVFEVIHKNELQPQAMQIVAKTVQQKMANNLMSNSSRPIENGLNGASPSLTKNDPKNLTREDLKEIRNRVARGERISW